MNREKPIERFLKGELSPFIVIARFLVISTGIHLKISTDKIETWLFRRKRKIVQDVFEDKIILKKDQ